MKRLQIHKFTSIILMVISLIFCSGCQFTNEKPLTNEPTPPVTETTREPTTEPGNTSDDIPEKWQSFFRKRTSYKLGINQRFNSTIMVHLLFIDDNESSWDLKTINEYMEKQIQPGLNFLKKQADNYGVWLKFSTKKYATVLGDGYELKYDGIVPENSFSNDIIDKAAIKMGYSGTNDMFYAFDSGNSYGENVFVALLNKKGRSYSTCQAEGYSNTAQSMEYAVVFTSYLNKDFSVDENTRMGATVAHEILHLYGAEDLYEPDDLKEVVQKLYPHEIMLLDYLHLEEMQVDPYTAYTVGWLDKPPF